MIVSISSDAEVDIAEGYWFYERQFPGLGDYFRSRLPTTAASMKCSTDIIGPDMLAVGDADVRAARGVTPRDPRRLRPSSGQQPAEGADLLGDFLGGRQVLGDATMLEQGIGFKAGQIKRRLQLPPPSPTPPNSADFPRFQPFRWPSKLFLDPHSDPCKLREIALV